MNVNAFDLLIVGSAVSLLMLPLAARRTLGPKGLDRSNAARVRFLIQTLTCLVPGLVSATSSGRLTNGVLTSAGMLVGIAMFASRSYPARLTRTGRIAFPLLAPVAGILLASVIALMADPSFIYAALGPALASAWGLTLVAAGVQARLHESHPVKMLFVGDKSMAEGFLGDLHAAQIRDHKIVGYIAGAHRAEDGCRTNGSVPYLGRASEINQVLQTHNVDLVVTALGHEGNAVCTTQISNAILSAGVRLTTVAALYEVLYGRVPLGALDGVWDQARPAPRNAAAAAAAKRIFDVVGAATLMAATLPILCISALLVKLQDGGPVLYRQRRVGAAGAEFTILKFRSMTIDAELSAGPAWSHATDPRVTRVGRLLRRSHLDELPQLYNVLRGEMSLVGPRPERLAFVRGFSKAMPHYDRRHDVKPGLTGWAQVRAGYGGSTVGTVGKLSYDLYYVKHRSISFDFLILVDTCRMLVAKAQFEVADATDAVAVGATDALSSGAVAGNGLSALGLMSPLLFPSHASTQEGVLLVSEPVQ